MTRVPERVKWVLAVGYTTTALVILLGGLLDVAVTCG